METVVKQRKKPHHVLDAIETLVLKSLLSFAGCAVEAIVRVNEAPKVSVIPLILFGRSSSFSLRICKIVNVLLAEFFSILSLKTTGIPDEDIKYELHI